MCPQPRPNSGDLFTLSPRREQSHQVMYIDTAVLVKIFIARRICGGVINALRSLKKIDLMQPESIQQRLEIKEEDAIDD